MERKEAKTVMIAPLIIMIVVMMTKVTKTKVVVVIVTTKEMGEGEMMTIMYARSFSMKSPRSAAATAAREKKSTE
jgi:hypothetical protein